jgi:hypothetical protein
VDAKRMERIVEEILELAGGTAPRSLADWTRVAGGAGLSIRITDTEAMLTGHTILLPRSSSDREMQHMIAHEVSEHLQRDISHRVATMVADRMARKPRQRSAPGNARPSRLGVCSTEPRGTQ